MIPHPASTAADLASITEAVDRARDRVAALAEPYLGTEREDVVSALYEAERELLGAHRALQRALRTVDT